jgi:predicted metal-binding protein
MTQTTLFICQSCCFSEDHPEDQPADGATLLQQLQTHQSSQPESNHIRIQPVGCLWDCGRACVVAYSAPRKPTYVFSSIPAASAPALLQFAQQYTQSKTGNTPHEKFPAVLQEVPVVKVPAITHEAFQDSQK